MLSRALPDSPVGAGAVRRWIDEFVSQPHPDLGRAGAVCPFVPAAIRQRTLVFRQGAIHRPPTLDTVIAGLRAGVAEFRTTVWDGRNSTLHAMLVLLPQLTDTEALLLDGAHAAIKDGLVKAEIMMAPLHPLCCEPASRNSNLLAFRSPVPMIAIRNMAFHDVMFLTQKREWFLRYAHRFGPRYCHSEGLDPLMVERYNAAARRYGVPTRAAHAV